MCCFSRRVQSVSSTRIFARGMPNGRQYLVYSMALNAPEDLAMILPIPVQAHSGERAVKFINLEGYPDFFVDLADGFRPPPSRSNKGFPTGAAEPRLAVVSVGSFDASFVPAVKDFSRLDPRFRLPAGTWDQLPQYKNYGFSVFKLKKGAHKVHPMAFSFPRADSHRLFFPTVHIHDGKVHETAGFDHTLYCQKLGTDSFQLISWDESHAHASSFMRIPKTAGIVLADQHAYQMKIEGRRKNADTWL